MPGELTYTNSTINSAILYYENPTGNVSALLQRTTSQSYPNILNGRGSSEEWIDIISQKSKSLPDEFRNTPGRNFSNYLYSNTLYESDVNVTYNTPFTSGANFSGWSVEAFIYSPSNTLLVEGALVSGSFLQIGYIVGANGTGNFSLGMHIDSSYPEFVG